VDPLDRTVAGLSCREVLHALSDYLDGELDADRLADVQQHLAGCDQCARFGGRVGGIIAALRAAGRAEQLPADTVQRLHDRLAVVRG
jgi:anti-sigma factor (TIGR02949 family)